MQFQTISSSTSQDCPAVSTDFSFSNLSFDHLFPLSTFETQAYNQETPLTLPDHSLPDTTATAKTNVMQMLHLRHSSFELYTKPDRAAVFSSSASSESSSVSLCTASDLSSVPSVLLEDWITKTVSDLDVLAPTVPDLSFSFTPPSRQKSTTHRFPTFTTGNITPPPQNEDQQVNSAGLDENNISLNANPTLVRTSNIDSSVRPTECTFKKSPLINARPNNSSRLCRPAAGDSPSMNGASPNMGATKFHNNKKNYAFLLPYNNSNKSRNSSYLESQLDFLAQHQSPSLHSALNSHEDIISDRSAQQDLLVQSQDKQESVEDADGSRRSSKNSHSLNFTPRKEIKRLKGRFLGLISHSNLVSSNDSSINSCSFQDHGRRQPRLSTCSLVDRANNFIFNSSRPVSRGPELEDEAINPKAWSDPTLSNKNTASTSGSRVKSSRSIFNLFLN